MNVAMYGKPSRWAMTERGRASQRRDSNGIDIGASSMRWEQDALTIKIEEVTFPVPSRLAGTITLRPRMIQDQTFALDKSGRHRWRPIAPISDVTVAFERPSLSWTGTGYFDTNSGSEPLEAAFRSWTWSRFDLQDHARIFYDVIESDGAERRLSLDVRADGRAVQMPSPPYQPLKSGLWGVERSVPADPGHRPTLLSKLEDAPFYTRSQIRSRIDGVDAAGVHESLSLRRVSAPLVRLMMPFRMPRRSG